MKIQKSNKINKYLDLARELKKKKAVEHEGEGDINCGRCCRNSFQRLNWGLEQLVIKGTIKTVQTKALLRLTKIFR